LATAEMAMLFGGGSTHVDTGKGNNDHTIHHNWLDDLVKSKMPRVLFGKGYLYNNCYNSPGNGDCIGSSPYASLHVKNNYLNFVFQATSHSVKKGRIVCGNDMLSHPVSKLWIKVTAMYGMSCMRVSLRYK
jgi:pectate lyase